MFLLIFLNYFTAAKISITWLNSISNRKTKISASAIIAAFCSSSRQIFVIRNAPILPAAPFALCASLLINAVFPHRQLPALESTNGFLCLE